jgi:nicotinamidase-related amidase
MSQDSLESNSIRDACIEPDDSVLCVVDVQEKLMPHIADHKAVEKGCRTMIEAAKILSVPLLWTEQYPKGLGRTVPVISEALKGLAVWEKTSFGCLGSSGVLEELQSLERNTLVLTGIETHVCVLQTALDALNANYRVAIVADAVGSRRESDRQLALERLRQAGGIIVSLEMILMEWVRDAADPRFKDILKLIK